MSSEASVLERRIGQIESRNRRLRWLIVALVIFTIVASAWAQGTSHPAVKATKFELYDEAGHLRAERLQPLKAFATAFSIKKANRT